VEAVNALKVRSCLIDGEAVACDDNGMVVFERLHQKREGKTATNAEGLQHGFHAARRCGLWAES
jgi:ATP-dependent DNA ligase